MTHIHILQVPVACSFFFTGSIPPNGYTTTYSTAAEHLHSVQLWTITQCAMNFLIHIF